MKCRAVGPDTSILNFEAADPAAYAKDVRLKSRVKRNQDARPRGNLPGLSAIPD